MLALKAQKKLLLAGTARFNIKPKVGLAFLEEKGLISTKGDSTTSRAMTIARFLKKSPRLDKKLLGEYISRKENAAILKEFINTYDFRGVSKGLCRQSRSLITPHRNRLEKPFGNS
jgi:brefeldin A-resistance guanine nucleotide exchange factor 1